MKQPDGFLKRHGGKLLQLASYAAGTLGIGMAFTAIGPYALLAAPVFVFGAGIGAMAPNPENPGWGVHVAGATTGAAIAGALVGLVAAAAPAAVLLLTASFGITALAIGSSIYASDLVRAERAAASTPPDAGLTPPSVSELKPLSPEFANANVRASAGFAASANSHFSPLHFSSKNFNFDPFSRPSQTPFSSHAPGKTL